MKISKFMSHIDNMSRKNKFTVEINMPALDLRIRGLRCRTVTTPGRDLEVDSFKVIPAGWAKHTVKGVSYTQEVALNFMLDSTFEDHQKIELWQQYIYNDDYSIRYPKNISGGKETGYLGTVQITQLDQSSLPVYEVTLEDAFPTKISGIGFDAGGAADIQTFDATFSYRTWHSSYENSPAGSILGALFQKTGRKLKSRVQKKVEDKVFKERKSLSNKLGLGD